MGYHGALSIRCNTENFLYPAIHWLHWSYLLYHYTCLYRTWTNQYFSRWSKLGQDTLQVTTLIKMHCEAQETMTEHYESPGDQKFLTRRINKPSALCLSLTWRLVSFCYNFIRQCTLMKYLPTYYDELVGYEQYFRQMKIITDTTTNLLQNLECTHSQLSFFA